MKEIKQLIARISGHRNRACYSVLACAVQAALSYQPWEPKMETLTEDVAQILGGDKTPAAVSRALSRVAADIWEHGDRRALGAVFGYLPQDPPTPKELVFRLAEYLWTHLPDREQSRPAVYQLREDLSGEGYGIMASLRDPGYFAATSAFCPDRATAEHLVRRLNEVRMPLSDFEMRYLSGSLLAWLKEAP